MAWISHPDIYWYCLFWSLDWWTCNKFTNYGANLWNVNIISQMHTQENMTKQLSNNRCSLEINNHIIWFSNIRINIYNSVWISNICMSSLWSSGAVISRQPIQHHSKICSSIKFIHIQTTKGEGAKGRVYGGTNP